MGRSIIAEGPRVVAATGWGVGRAAGAGIEGAGRIAEREGTAGVRVLELVAMWSLTQGCEVCKGLTGTWPRPRRSGSE